MAAWAGATNPVGTMLVVTTATRFRQVRNQLWPHIRKVVSRAGLPGFCDEVQWKMPDQWGNNVIVAYGFTAQAHDEASMQGIHGNPRLVIIVDEAGGIARSIGNGTNNLLTGDARMLAIGNPAMDDPRSWFEVMCEEGDDPDEPGTVTIPIATYESPAITGEKVPYCLDCPPSTERHSLAIHLPAQDWIDRTIREYGEDHPYVIAKVHAKFPKGGGGKVIPTTWVEDAKNAEDPTGPDWIRLGAAACRSSEARLTSSVNQSTRAPALLLPQTPVDAKGSSLWSGLSSKSATAVVPAKASVSSHFACSSQARPVTRRMRSLSVTNSSVGQSSS